MFHMVVKAFWAITNWKSAIALSFARQEFISGRYWWMDQSVHVPVCGPIIFRGIFIPMTSGMCGTIGIKTCATVPGHEQGNAPPANLTSIVKVMAYIYGMNIQVNYFAAI